jgi:signal transduction histidine kinase
MPDIDSVALVKFIRSRYGSLPVILVADTATEDVAREALKCPGADFYLRKQRDAQDPSAEPEYMIRQAVMRRQEDEAKQGGFLCGYKDSPGPKTAGDQLRWRASCTDQNPDPVIEIDLNKEILSAIIADAKKRLDPGAISLKDQSAGISIYADPLFSQVLSCLMDNSLRYGEHVTAICISGQITAAGLVLVYEDDGVGIPENKKEKIFNRVVDRKSGIGLFLVREILSITGITIKENGTPGKGARFEMTVPKKGYRVDP